MKTKRRHFGKPIGKPSYECKDTNNTIHNCVCIVIKKTSRHHYLASFSDSDNNQRNSELPDPKVFEALCIKKARKQAQEFLDKFLKEFWEESSTYFDFTIYTGILNDGYYVCKIISEKFNYSSPIIGNFETKVEAILFGFRDIEKQYKKL